MSNSSTIFIAISVLVIRHWPTYNLHIQNLLSILGDYLYKFRLVIVASSFFLTGLLATNIANDLWGPVVVTCLDGWHSPSIGRQGACSHHGGIKPDPRSGWIFLISLVSAIVTFLLLKALPNKSTTLKSNLYRSEISHHQPCAYSKPRESAFSEAERKRRRYFALKKRKRKKPPS